MSTATLPATLPAYTADAGVDYDDVGLLRVPKVAHTLAGFRRWVLSDAFPEKLPVMFLTGEVYVDMSKEEIF